MAKRRGKRWVAECYDKATQQKRHLGTFDTKGEAAEAEAKHRLRGRPQSHELADVFARRWTRDYPRPRRSSTMVYETALRPFIRDFAGVQLSDVTKPRARVWALEHRSSLGAIRAMYGDALRDGIVESNPFAGLRISASRGRKDITALTEAELQHLADTAHHPEMKLGRYAAEYRAMILFAGYVGCRPGELFALDASDVEGQFCHISRGWSSTAKVMGPTKNGQARTVTIPPAAQDALLEVPSHANGLLFVTPMGKQWRQENHQNYWKRLCKLAGPLDLDFYELRHCAATMLLERGVTPWDVAIQLGHEDGGQLVMERYGHPSEAGARSRLLAAWNTAPIGSAAAPSVSGANRVQAV
jgi:integrase